jgi:CBS domain-containing protein
MKIKDIMTRTVEAMNEAATIRSVAAKMKQLDVGVMPVLDNGNLLGLVTDRDIVIRAVAEGKDPDSSTVADIMTRSVITCSEEDDVSEAEKLMEEKKIRRIPVTDAQDHIVGILSLGDLAKSVDKSDAGEVLRDVSEEGRPER